jgi:hypothetical protein
MTPVKPQKSNKGFNFYFQMPEFIMKIFNYLHLIIHFRLNVTIFMLLALLVAAIRYRK